MTPGQLLDQSIVTGKHYLECAERYLREETKFSPTFENCMRIADLMASDFDLMMNFQEMQSINESFGEIARSLNSLVSQNESELFTEEDE
tara:strand:- start:950 stop:1219 length:270 start_codon:yes stop_codon:yes gene_type:complete